MKKKTAVAIISNLPDIELEKLELMLHVSSYLLKDDFIREIDIRLMDMKEFGAIPVDWIEKKIQNIPNAYQTAIRQIILEWKESGNEYEYIDDDI